MIPLLLGLGGLVAKAAAAATLIKTAVCALKAAVPPVSESARPPEKSLYGQKQPTEHKKRYFGQGVLQGVTKLFYTFDHLGSVRELIDSSGVVQAVYRYSTYGERAKLSGNLESDWGYAGLWHHGPSGLDLATYRVYDAANRRWISRDPLGEGVDYNLYRYCNNSPVNFRDPMGLYAEVDVSEPDSEGRIDVTIILPNEYYGAGANPATIAKLNADIEKAWTRDIGKYRVKTKVVSCPDRDDKHKNRILLYDNRLEPPRGLSSNTGSFGGDWYTSRAGSSTSPAGHEAGHSMGLGDLRNLQTNEPFPDATRNIMAGTPRRGIEPWQIESIIRNNPRVNQ